MINSVMTTQDSKKPYRNYRTFSNLLYAASVKFPLLKTFIRTYDPKTFSGLIDIFDEPTNSVLRILALSFDPYKGSKANMIKASKLLRMASRDMVIIADALEVANPYTERPSDIPGIDTTRPLNLKEHWEVFGLFKFLER